MLRSPEEPIVALATPPGTAGLAVIRVSGSGCLAIVDRLFRGKKLLDGSPGGRAYYGKLTDQTGQVIDEVVCTVFRSPHSYTGQDSVEISCHGGPVIYSSILSELNASGIRNAEPGEFTRRAFLNGRMDLAQAESVADLIHSAGNLSRRSSLFQLSGTYSTRLKTIRDELIHIMALLELELDFSDEDVEFASRTDMYDRMKSVEAYLQSLTESYVLGRVIREGVRLVIAGKPNAGKSTLLNYLLGEDRAIVTEIAGTTRDTLDASVIIRGISFILIDTAGLRDTQDIVEKLGVDRSHEAIMRADIVLYLYDSSVGLQQEEKQFLDSVTERNSGCRIVLAGTKADLSLPTIKSSEELLISAKTGDGIEELKDLLVQAAVGSANLNEASSAVTNARHLHALEEARKAIGSAAESVQAQVSQDFIASDIRHAIASIGEVTGEVTTDEILNHIFAKFCIGK